MLLETRVTPLEDGKVVVTPFFNIQQFKFIIVNLNLMISAIVRYILESVKTLQTLTKIRQIRIPDNLFKKR